jgi:hypothetical protein
VIGATRSVLLEYGQEQDVARRSAVVIGATRSVAQRSSAAAASLQGAVLQQFRTRSVQRLRLNLSTKRAEHTKILLRHKQSGCHHAIHRHQGLLPVIGGFGQVLLLRYIRK